MGEIGHSVSHTDTTFSSETIRMMDMALSRSERSLTIFSRIVTDKQTGYSALEHHKKFIFNLTTYTSE